MSQAEVRSKLLRVLVKAVAPAAGVVSLLAQLTVKAIPPRSTVEWVWLMAAVVFTVAPPFIPGPERAAAPPDPPPPPLPTVAIGFVPRDEPWARWLAGILELAGEAPSLRPWSSSAGLGAVPGDDRTVFVQSRSVDFLEPAAQDRIRAWLEQADALILRIDQNARTVLHGAGRPPVNMDFATEDVAWEAVSARLDLGLPGASVSRIRRELEQPAGGTPTRGGYPRTGPRIHNLQRRTSEFVGRAAELELIERTLLDPTATGFGLCVLSGLPGVGKTSIAAEYAIRALEHYRIVWWITADISSTVASGLLDLCAELGLPDIGDGPANVKALWTTLMRRSDWLLILDNLEPAAEIAGHLPEEGLRAGRVLVTSRRPDLPVPLSGGVAVEVEEFDTATATRYILRRTGQVDATAAAEIADRTGCLALALEQAVAYIRATRFSLRRFVGVFDHWLRTLGDDGAGGHHRGVVTTIRMAAGEIANEPGAADLLGIVAVLAPEIPGVLFLGPSDAPAALPPPLRPITDDVVRMGRLIGALSNAALVKSRAGHDSLSAHRLTQQVVWETMTTQQQDTARARAVGLLAAAFPGAPTEPATFDWAERLVPQVAAVIATERLPADTALAPEVAAPLADLTFRVAQFLEVRGSYADAEDYLRVSIEHRARLDGPTSLSVAAGHALLAQLSHRRARLSEALAAAQRAYDIYESSPDALPEQRLDAVIWLCRTKIELSRLAAARTDIRHAQAIADEFLDRRSLSYAGILDEIGILLWRTGHFRPSLAVVEEALAIKQELSGVDFHSMMLTTKHVGMLLREIGVLANDRETLRLALSYKVRAMAIVDEGFLRLTAEQTGGRREYIERCRLEADAGQIHLDLGDVETGLAMLRDAYAKHVVNYSQQHPNTAGTGLMLARAEAMRGDYAAARSLAEASRTVFADMFGAEHPYVAQALVVLGPIVRRQGDLVAARRLMDLARSLTVDAYGESPHPKFVPILLELAEIQAAEGDHDGSRSLRERAENIRQIVLAEPPDRF